MWQPLGRPAKIGLYTSPHLVSVRERIQINGVPVSETLFAAYFFEVWEAVSSKPSYTSFLTILAFHIFIKEGVNAAVVEAVVGGEYDSTNIICMPTVVGITPVGLDHIKTLGPELKDIARQKAGIFKANAPAFSAPQSSQVKEVFEDVAGRRKTDLPKFIDIHSSLGNVTEIPRPLRANASLAYAMYLSFKGKAEDRHADMPPEVIGTILNTDIPGRFQRLIKGNHQFLLDGAHTTDSIAHAITWVKTR